jgi:tetratricopeptide (TPR) repeat protein
MQRWLSLGLLFGLSGMLWAQQDSAPVPSSSSSSSSPSSQSPDSSSGSNQSNPPANSAPPNLDFPKKQRVPNLAAPRSDRVQVDDLNLGVGESSSKDTDTDLSAPADDAKAHPQSSAAVAEAEAGGSGGGITEFHTWDPHKAAKSVEVGDFYFKRKNYRAAEDRYREALRYKDNDAVATIRLAVCLEKLAVWDDARAEYESYLRILPHGPQAAEAEKAIDRLKAQTAGK